MGLLWRPQQMSWALFWFRRDWSFYFKFFLLLKTIGRWKMKKKQTENDDNDIKEWDYLVSWLKQDMGSVLEGRQRKTRDRWRSCLTLLPGNARPVAVCWSEDPDPRVSCLTMPEPSCCRRPEPCEPDKQADGRRDRREVILELSRNGTLLLVFGILPPCKTMSFIPNFSLRKLKH